MEGKKYVILRGYGLYYGHNIKCEVFEYDEPNNSISIKQDDDVVVFDTVSGFEDKHVYYSGYQLDINTIDPDVLNLTDDTTYELGKV